MANKLDLSSFESLMKQGNNFEMTEEQYEMAIKKAMPQTGYLRTKSPVAKLAKKYGYKIQVEERIHRVITFQKKEKVKQ